MLKTTFIYALIDPLDCRERYIGKSNNPQSRLRGHIFDSKTNDYPVHRWIRKLARLSLVPTVIILEEINQAAWKEAERKWIAHYSHIHCDLLNLAPGGEGPYDYRRIEKGEERYNAILNDAAVREIRRL